MRGPRVPLVLLVVLALAGAALLTLAACGGGAPLEPSASSSAVKAAVLDTAEGGFSLKYPASFVKVEPDVAGRPGLIYQVLLADPTGAKSGGSALDVLGVMVREMSKPAEPGDLKKHKAEFEAMARQLIGEPAGLKVGPLKLTTLGGRPALRAECIYTVNGDDVASVGYLVPVGERVYWVTGQASRGTWDTTGKTIGAAMSTIEFSPGAGT